MMSIFRIEKNKCLLLSQIFLIALIVFVFFSCQKESQVPGLIVNSQFSDKNLSDSLVTRLRVKFITTSAFKPFDKDYKITAEALSKNNVLFREVLEVIPPTSRWQMNRVYEIEKYVYFPPFLDRFNPEMRGGARVDFRIILESESGKSPLVIFKNSFQLSPCPLDIPDIVYLQGWDRISTTGSGKAYPLREGALWTQRSAVCLLKNPKRAAILMIRGRCEIPEGQKIYFSLGPKLLDEFEQAPGPWEKIYSLTAADLGQEPELRLVITVNKTVRADSIYPGVSKDKDKELGLKIETLYFR
jgi:hypothetical protein